MASATRFTTSVCRPGPTVERHHARAADKRLFGAGRQFGRVPLLRLWMDDDGSTDFRVHVMTPGYELL